MFQVIVLGGIALAGSAACEDDATSTSNSESSATNTGGFPSEGPVQLGGGGYGAAGTGGFPSEGPYVAGEGGVAGQGGAGGSGGTGG
jgi:hypothetical protein